jgi:transposase
LRNFGRKIGMVGAVKFEDRIGEIVEDRSDLAEIMAPLLAAREKLRTEFKRLHKKVLAITREDATCKRLMTIPGVGATTS